MHEGHDDRGTTARLLGTRWHDVRWFARLDSTNTHLLGLAAAGAPDGLVVVADEQTAGRGRLDRRWEAPAGSSLLASALLRAAVAPGRRPLLLAAAACAAVDAVRSCTEVPAALKWPNDVVVDDRKLGGLLAESAGDAVVVGFGCNVSWPALPPDLAATATALNLASPDGEAPPVGDLLVAWLEAFDARVAELEAGDAHACVAALRERMTTLGRRVRVELPHAHVEGVATGLTDLGHLLVRADDGPVHEITTGDVVHLRHA